MRKDAPDVKKALMVFIWFGSMMLLTSFYILFSFFIELSGGRPLANLWLYVVCIAFFLLVSVASFLMWWLSTWSYERIMRELEERIMRELEDFNGPPM
jgi:type III secretory pathway component EscU